MGTAYHREQAEKGPVVLERLSDLDEARKTLGEFTDIRGRTVINPKGDEVGTVDNLYMDPKQGKVVMASISFGGVWGFGAKHVLVPMSEIELVDDNRVRVMTTPEIVKNAPEFPAEGCADFSIYDEYWCQASERTKNQKAA